MMQVGRVTDESDLKEMRLASLPVRRPPHFLLHTGSSSDTREEPRGARGAFHFCFKESTPPARLFGFLLPRF